MHAVYKPWGAGTVMYLLQHGSLFVTSFVFLMGLLFKVGWGHQLEPPVVCWSHLLLDARMCRLW